MRAQGEGAEFYISGGSLPPGRRAAGSLQGPLRKFFLFTYRFLPPTCRAVGPLPPPAGRQGYRTVKPKTKNIFL